MKANSRKTGRTIVLLLLFGAMALAALNVSMAARFGRQRRCIFSPPPPTRVLHEDNCALPENEPAEPGHVLRVGSGAVMEFRSVCPASNRCPYVRQAARCPYLAALNEGQCPFLRSHWVRPEQAPS